MTMSAVASTSHEYAVFGLKVRSELELPELFANADGDDADVCISLGKAGGAADAAPGIHSDGNALVLVVADVARFRIASGASIVVEPLPGVPERNVRLFLLGSAFGALLHQRGLLPLHANAVEVDGKAVAFMGESGAGKSTLAAWFHDAGYRVLADDVCVIRFDEQGRPAACPGLPRLRLWAEALKATGRDAEGFQRSYVGETVYDKYDVPLPGHAQAPLPLAAFYVLGRGDRLSFERLEGSAAADVLFAHTYRGAFVAQAGSQVDHWSSCVDLLRSTPLFLVRRVWGLDAVDDGARALLGHASRLINRD